jgi:hypothetical protein
MRTNVQAQIYCTGEFIEEAQMPVILIPVLWVGGALVLLWWWLVVVHRRTITMAKKRRAKKDKGQTPANGEEEQTQTNAGPFNL